MVVNMQAENLGGSLSVPKTPGTQKENAKTKSWILQLVSAALVPLEPTIL